MSRLDLNRPSKDALQKPDAPSGRVAGQIMDDENKQRFEKRRTAIIEEINDEDDAVGDAPLPHNI